MIRTIRRPFLRANVPSLSRPIMLLRRPQETMESVKESAAHLKESAQGAAHRAEEGVVGAAHTVKDKAASAVHGLQEGMHTAKVMGGIIKDKATGLR